MSVVFSTPKMFCSFESQIKKIESRHMNYDYNELRQYLRNCNYYRLSGYWYFFKAERSDNFIPGTNFTNVARLYEFDADLRKIIFAFSELAEIKLRTVVAYIHTRKYGATGYLNPNNFVIEYDHARFKTIIKDRKNKSENEDFVIHHNQKYGDDWPLWVLVEILSFENTCILYKYLKGSEKYEIKNEFINIDPLKLSYTLKNIIDLRNECAHHLRIVYKTSNKIKVKKPYFDGNQFPEYAFNNVGLFTYIYAMKELIGYSKQYTSLVNKLDILIKNNPDVDISRLGFPPKWKCILLSTTLDL